MSARSGPPRIWTPEGEYGLRCLGLAEALPQNAPIAPAVLSSAPDEIRQPTDSRKRLSL